MGDHQDRLVNLFHEALDKSAGEEREHYLAEACAGNEALRQQLQMLLEAREQAGDFLNPPTPATPKERLLDESPGDVIGRYKLLQVIGEGGFGRVYMAEQLEPVRRKVALKILKLGMDTREVVARFEAERQALALMDHPNIAQVLDGGSTGSGRPYFVMELVKGVPITDYCDRQNLSTQERLALFGRACHAVQHAHQKGVIHRDLKPSNILVTELEGEAVPKIIDFGVAKAIGQPLTDKTLFTRLEQVLGPDHDRTLASKGRLALWCGASCRWRDSSRLAKAVLNSTNRFFRVFYGADPAPQMLSCFGGALASLLAGDQDAYRSLADKVYDCFCQKPDAENARIVLEIDALLPGAEGISQMQLPRTNITAFFRLFRP